MSDCMAFPKTAEEFIEQYKFTDTKQEYTNGAELMPVFRVKQMLEHYFANGIRALDRLGEFGRLFVGYKGCPRGAVGRSCAPLEEEVFEMPKIMDVDGGEWIPVNAAALHELVGQYEKLREAARWIPVTERLPLAREVQWDDLRYMESDLVLGFGGDGIAVVKHTRELGTDRWLWIDIDGNAWPVTHWMPLPEPPKGE